ncbi:Hypothetical protein (Fragment) [Durusdinium trenchii]|uniref:Acyltransferase 3 domain-containing protein n=1 Tax=Durusdinium trenchii TaxID=1381693 RepID=A0ABP0KQA9_9DINO
MEFRLTRKVPIQSLPVDGLRGFAAFHIILGHLFMWSETHPRYATPENAPAPTAGLCSWEIFAGFPLMGGGSMGLFYIISGFVMAIGYCQVMLEPGFACRCLGAGYCCCPEQGHFRPLARLSAWLFWCKRLMRLDVFGDMPHYSYEVTWVDYVLTFLGLTSWSLRLPLGNELTWTISTMCMGLFGSYWLRMTPPLRLPVFVMGLCAGLIRIQRQQAAMKDSDLDLTPISRSERPEVLDGACCEEPCIGPWSLFGIWFLFTGLSVAAAVQCGILVGLRAVLEVFFPILFYYWVLAITSPLHQSSSLVAFFNSRIMQFLGNISMSAYMIHMLLMEFQGYLIGTRINSHPWWVVLTMLPMTLVLRWFLTELLGSTQLDVNGYRLAW